MLTKNSLEIAAQYASTAGQRGVSLYAMPGTPLANLVQATRASGSTQMIDISKPDFRLQEYIDNVLYMSNTRDETLGGSPHDFAMDEMITLIGTSVAGHFSNVRNKVKPDIVTFVENMKVAVDGVNNEDITKQFEVKVWRPIAPIANGTITPYYEKYAESKYSKVDLSVKLPNKTDVEIKELMLTLNPTADIDIVEWMAEMGSTFFNNIWETVFQVNPNTNWHYLEEVFADKEAAPNCALAIFLLASNLYDNPPEGTNMSLSSFNTYMTDYRNQAALQLINYADRYNVAVRNDILVKSSQNRLISVYEPVYKKWIDEGGRNEVLFGLSLRDGIPDFTKNGINANAQAYLEEWARFVSYTRTANKINHFTIVRDLLVSVFVKQFSPNDALLNAFKNEVNKITEKDVSDMWGLAKHLICCTVYCATDAEIILNDFEAIQAESPGMDPREVAALVMLKNLARWGSSQIQVVR